MLDYTYFNDSNDENNFWHKLLFTNAQVSGLSKTFPNGSSANLNLSKTKLHKTWQSGGLLGRHLEPLLKDGLPLMKNVLKPLQSVTKYLRLTLVFMWNNTLQEKFYCYFSGLFC